MPGQAIAYLEAVRRYYQPGVTRLPRNADIAAAHVPRLEPRTWDRRKSDLRSGKWYGKDWVEVWPPGPDWHPSWEPLLGQPDSAAKPDHADAGDGLVHLMYEETYDPTNGKLVERRLLRTFGHIGSLAAGVAYMMLDLSDGRLDGMFGAVRYSHLLLDDLAPSLCRVLT